VSYTRDGGDVRCNDDGERFVKFNSFEPGTEHTRAETHALRRYQCIRNSWFTDPDGGDVFGMRHRAEPPTRGAVGGGVGRH
jgi:hypothetical protein